MYRIGLDIGGTTFSFAIVKNNKIIKISKTYSILEYKTYQEFLVKLVNEINSVLKEIKLKIVDIDFLGISCPGPLDSESGRILDTPNLTILANTNLVEDISKLSQIKQIKLEKDTNVFALGEAYLYYPKAKSVLVITLGTGVGFGIIINGQLYKGNNGLAGEYGVTSIGNGKNWEDLLGKKYFQKQSLAIFSANKTAKELAELCLKGNTLAKNIWDRFGDNLGKCLSHPCNLLDPEAIIIGGGVSLAFNYYKDKLLTSLEKNSIVYRHSKLKIIPRLNWMNSFYLGAAKL